jgi:hypothetical protein
MDNLLDNSFRVLFFVGAMVAIYGAYWLGRSGDPASAGVMAVAGILLCVFVYLHRFKRFEGLGFKGELWEREMEQAAELRRGLTDLAEQLGESVVWQMAPRRRPHEGRPFQEKLAIVERTTDILTGIGVTPQRIDELKTPWHKFVMFDLERVPIWRNRFGIHNVWLL